MQTWIALLRGVNVGGKNKLPMKALVAELEALGFVDVQTYIQSGNVVFRRPSTATAASIASSIATGIKMKFGFQPSVMVLSKEELAAAAKSNPFPEAEGNGTAGPCTYSFSNLVPRKRHRRSIAPRSTPSNSLASDGAWRVPFSICTRRRVSEPRSSRRRWNGASVFRQLQGIGARFVS